MANARFWVTFEFFIYDLARPYDGFLRWSFKSHILILKIDLACQVTHIFQKVKGTFCTGTAVTLVFQDKVGLWLSLYTIRAFSRSLNNFAGMSFMQTTN